MGRKDFRGYSPMAFSLRPTAFSCCNDSMTRSLNGSIYLIVNPVAGRGHGAKVARYVSGILSARGVAHEVRYSSAPHEPTELAQAAVKEGCSRVVAVGGDGLVHQMANVLVGTGTTLGIIPAGIGNDFARGLGIPLDIDKAVDVISTWIEEHNNEQPTKELIEARVRG